MSIQADTPPVEIDPPGQSVILRSKTPPPYVRA
jgi:hypothetical protein